MEINNWAKDKIDERHYNIKMWWGWESPLPKHLLLDTEWMQNQKADWYKMWCVYYSASEACNYSIKDSWDRTKGSTLCDESDTRNNEDWDYIINWPKLLKKNGLIAWYSQVSSLQEIKVSIYNKRPVCSWSKSIDWSTIKAEPFVAGWNFWSWHAFFIVWYDDLSEHLICQNSYGDAVYDEGYFYIKYEDLDKLFNTRISLIEDENTIIAHKKRIMEDINIEDARIAFLNGYWNGENPTKPITREEAAAMIERATNNK